MLTIDHTLEKTTIAQSCCEKKRTFGIRFRLAYICLVCLQRFLNGLRQYYSRHFVSLHELATLRVQTAEKSLSHSDKGDVLQCEISSDKINELLAGRQICAADIHCLDECSKRRLRELCLKTCLYSSMRWSQ